MKKKFLPDLRQAGTRSSASQAEWVTKMSLLASTNREVYRALREIMWQFVVENSARSDFPSEMS